jgi:photosystem II stability/assembly factor-like uncharacterized protein
VVVVLGPGRSDGVVENTRDGGATWSREGQTHFPAGASIQFVDPEHGWAVEDDVLYRTADGGVTWTIVYRAVQAVTVDSKLVECGWLGVPVFATSAMGAVGFNCPGAVAPKVAFTNDGGTSWHSIRMPALPSLSGVTWQTGVGSIQFFGPQVVVAYATQCAGTPDSCSAYGAMYESIDGGKSWKEGAEEHGAGLGFQAVSPSDAFVIGSWASDPYHPWLLVTANAGITWAPIKLPSRLGPSKHGSRNFDFVDPAVGFVLTDDVLPGAQALPPVKFYKTVDGGQSFQQFVPAIE